MNKISEKRLAELNWLNFNTKYFLPQRPLLITDGAIQSPAFRRWSPEYLNLLIGSTEVNLACNENGIFNYNRSSDTGPITFQSMTFRDATKAITTYTKGSAYLQQLSIKHRVPELLADLPRVFVLDPLKTVLLLNFWFSGRGCKTPLHFDRSDNFLIQVFGKKRVTLFAPRESKYLYPGVGEDLPYCSQVNVFNPNTIKFPLYSKTSCIQFDLNPGAILYIPAQWWHAVETLETSVSVNYWWHGFFEQLCFKYHHILNNIYYKYLSNKNNRFKSKLSLAIERKFKYRCTHCLKLTQKIYAGFCYLCLIG